LDVQEIKRFALLLGTLLMLEGWTVCWNRIVPSGSDREFDAWQPLFSNFATPLLELLHHVVGRGKPNVDVSIDEAQIQMFSRVVRGVAQATARLKALHHKEPDPIVLKLKPIPVTR
jgi:lipoate-protein ligase A